MSKKREPNKENFKFKNYFKSEPQLLDIDHTSDPADILNAYQRIVSIYAKNHVRERVELEDLISEANLGICKAIEDFNNPTKKKRSYTFNQACLYKIREAVFQYCLRNATQLKTPYYIQRGCMHVAQIHKLMQNQKVAENLLQRPGPASDVDIVEFLYKEDERLPLKSEAFIRAQINKQVSEREFEQIYFGIINHEQGTKHSYIKSKLSDEGKALHIKQKIWYTATSNHMSYTRVIDLILLARQVQTVLDPTMQEHSVGLEKKVLSRQVFEHGEKVCGKLNFEILVESKCLGKTYDELSAKYSLKKNTITEIIKDSIDKLKDDNLFKELFKEV